jgi:hypothetical protein
VKMTTQEAHKICACLGAARVLLKKSDGETASIARRIEIIEGNMRPGDPTYIGDAGAAKATLDEVVDELARMRKMRPAVAVINDAMIPNAKPELLPGVSDAINQIGKAAQLLRLVRDGGR